MKHAFIKSIPILCSYVFVSMAYGIMMEEAGFHWYYSLLISLTVYTGAFQFVLITFLSSGASILTIALTALLMNSRQTFYSLTFIDEFKKMGKRLPYMIHTMTDETYAVNLTLEAECQDEKKKEDSMFGVAFLSRCYWMFGAVLGGVLGQLIPFELEGIDFCMTALFVTILIDKWKVKKDRKFVITGLVFGTISLFVFGAKSFIFPAMLFTMLLLVVERKFSNKRFEDNV